MGSGFSEEQRARRTAYPSGRKEMMGIEPRDGFGKSTLAPKRRKKSELSFSLDLDVPKRNEKDKKLPTQIARSPFKGSFDWKVN